METKLIRKEVYAPSEHVLFEQGAVDWEDERTLLVLKGDEILVLIRDEKDEHSYYLLERMQMSLPKSPLCTIRHKD